MPALALVDSTIEQMGSEQIVIKKTLSPMLSYNWNLRLTQAFRLISLQTPRYRRSALRFFPEDFFRTEKRG